MFFVELETCADLRGRRRGVLGYYSFKFFTGGGEYMCFLFQRI